MSVMAANRPSEGLGTPLWFSALFHIGLGGAIVIAMLVSHHGENWGAEGGSISVGIAGSVPAIPLPRPDVVSPSRIVDNSRSLYKAPPAPDIKLPPPDAVPLPRFSKLKPPPPPKKKPVERAEARETPPPPKIHPRDILENNTPPPMNAVPDAEHGAPTVPVTTFTMGAGKSQAGLTFNGANNGNFGSRFAWYVEAVQRRVSSNWLQSTIDPSVQSAPEVIITFTVLRDGTITNIHPTQSSNNYSVDASAIRAVKDSSPLDQLPAGYSGSYINVQFTFDYRR